MRASGRRARRVGLRWCFWLALAAPLLPPAIASAWNASGHMQIALAAHAQLPSELAQSLTGLLHEHPRFDLDFRPHLPPSLSEADQARWIFAHAATWPDLARATPEYHRPTWHFINLRLRLQQGALGSCKQARSELEQLPAHEQQKETILTALEHNARRFGDRALPASERALALSWLLHLVGDAHQPLHAVALFSAPRFPNGDRGGNEILVRGRGSLHRSWDELGGEALALPELDRQVGRWVLPDTRPEAIDVGDFRAWIFEGCNLARSHVYVPAVLRAVESDREKVEVSLVRAYFDAARPVAERRMARAALRLAALLRGLAAEREESRRSGGSVR